MLHQLRTSEQKYFSRSYFLYENERNKYSTCHKYLVTIYRACLQWRK